VTSSQFCKSTFVSLPVRSHRLRPLSLCKTIRMYYIRSRHTGWSSRCGSKLLSGRSSPSATVSVQTFRLSCFLSSPWRSLLPTSFKWSLGIRDHPRSLDLCLEKLRVPALFVYFRVSRRDTSNCFCRNGARTIRTEGYIPQHQEIWPTLLRVTSTGKSDSPAFRGRTEALTETEMEGITFGSRCLHCWLLLAVSRP